MLKRDQYKEDPCLQHFPDTSFESFQSYMAGLSPFRRMFMDNSEFEKELNFRNTCIVSTLFVSLLPIFLHKRIYFLRNYHSRKARVLFGIAWVYLPMSAVGTYFNSITSREMMMKYEINKDVFTRMLEAGDINITNPKVQWADA